MNDFVHLKKQTNNQRKVMISKEKVNNWISQKGGGFDCFVFGGANIVARKCANGARIVDSALEMRHSHYWKALWCCFEGFRARSRGAILFCSQWLGDVECAIRWTAGLLDAAATVVDGRDRDNSFWSKMASASSDSRFSADWLAGRQCARVI